MTSKWNSDGLDLVSQLLSKITRSDGQSMLQALSLSLRLLLIEVSSKQSIGVSDRRRQSASECMQKLWRTAVHGDISLWIHAAATYTGSSDVSGTQFDEGHLEEVMSNSMLYKLLRETLSFSKRFTASEVEGDEATNLFALCVDTVLEDTELISADVFDHSLQSARAAGTDESDLKVVNDISRKQIHVVVKKCVNFASIV